jgi:hypothetical protein
MNKQRRHHIMRHGNYWICLVLAALLGCSDPKQIMPENAMLETVRQ